MSQVSKVTNRSIDSLRNESISFLPGNFWQIGNRTTNARPQYDDEDLTVMGVVIFLIKWLWGVIIEVLSLLPQWILITVGVLLFARYLLMPLGMRTRDYALILTF